MCHMCYSYIHDTILSPLPINHPLKTHIHLPSLNSCIHKLVPQVTRIISMIPSSLTSLAQTILITEEFIDCIVEVCPDILSEFHFTTIICLDANLTRKTKHPIDTIQQFVDLKLHVILKQILEIHHEHTYKPPPCKVRSLGSVPEWKLSELRSKSGSNSLSDMELYG